MAGPSAEVISRDRARQTSGATIWVWDEACVTARRPGDRGAGAGVCAVGGTEMHLERLRKTWNSSVVASLLFIRF